jgi:hypothetical protein
VGLLPPLNAPHHPRSTEWTKYREGVVLESAPNNQTKGGNNKGKGGNSNDTTTTSLVNVGLEKPVQIHKHLRAKDRVTVRLKDKGFKALDEDDEEEGANNKGGGSQQGDYYRGKLVSIEEPRKRKGIFWGYSVRIAHSITEALQNGPYQDEGGYDLKIGTSERGDVFHPSGPSSSSGDNGDNSHDNDGDDIAHDPAHPLLQAPRGRKGDEGGSSASFYKGFKHAIIAFGAVDGLEFALKNDAVAQQRGVKDPKDLFDLYLNTCASQGSRTIRAEEAMMISMACLSFDIQKNIQYF